MSDFAGELTIVGAALVSPLATTPAAHAFFARAGATPATAALDGTMKGTFACPWIPERSSLGVRLAALASQAIAALLADLPESVRARADIEVVIALPDEAQGVTEEDAWIVERSARTALHGTCATLAPVVDRPRGMRTAFDEVLRTARDLSQEALRLIVAVDSPAHPERARSAPDDRDSPWDPAPTRRSEAASGLLLATAAGAAWGSASLQRGPRAAEARLPIWGRLRGAATRAHDSTPDNDVPSDGSALSGAIRALPGRSVFAMVAGPEPLSGFFREELALAVARDFERFRPAYHPLRPAALLGDVGIASLPASIALALATLRHGTLRRSTASGERGPEAADADEQAGPALIWDLFPDGARAVLSLEASLDPLPAHRATHAADAGGRSPDAAPIPAVPAGASSQKATRRSRFTEVEEGCLERLLSLCRSRKEAPWRELPGVEERILANLDALVETGVSFTEACQSLAHRSDPFGGIAAAFLLGALGQKGADGAAVFEDTVVALFGPGAEARIDAGDPTLDALWLASEGLFLRPSAISEQALLRWIEQGPSLVAALALVALARRLAVPHERVGRRLGRREPLFTAAVARAASFSPELSAHKDSWRSLLDAAGPLAWEGARALLLAGDDAPLARLRAGDAFADRLGPQSLCLLALAGREEDIPLFARLARRLPRTEITLRATGDFGWTAVAGLLLSALEDEATTNAAGRALSTMFGPLPERTGRAPRAAWGQAIEQATWASDERARDGKPWSAESIARPADPEGLSDREWQFRIDELRFVSKKASLTEPGGFGSAARGAVIAAIAREERGTR